MVYSCFGYTTGMWYCCKENKIEIYCKRAYPTSDRVVITLVIPWTSNSHHHWVKILEKIICFGHSASIFVLI